MRRRKISTWLNHPVSFLFWFFVGLFVLKFTTKNQHTQASQVTQLSSIAEDTEGLSETNYQDIQAIPDDELFSQLEKNRESISVLPETEDAEELYALSPEMIEDIDQKIYNQPEYREDYYQPISEETVKVDYEDPKNPKVCSGNRLYYEKQLAASLKIKDLLVSRAPEDKKLPKKCIIHVMNNAAFDPRRSMGLCGNAWGPVRLPGAKPCVSENLVNATYNSYVDVMDCLNLNPKLFFPKISQESGFLVNAYGAGKDGGIGQFTKSAIDAVNIGFKSYLDEIEKAASTKPSCARIMAYKSLLTKAPSSPAQRCSMIGLPENPLRNILYTGMFNRMQMDGFSGIKFIAGQDFIQRDSQLIPVNNDERDEFEGMSKAYKFKESLEELGIKNPNMHIFKEIIALAGYNMGSPTALRLFSKYLSKRKAAKKTLTYDDFDFNKIRLAKDVYGDGKEKSAIDIARSFIMSSFISKKDKQATVNIKLRKRKQLPKEWAASHLKSFPEFLTYNANSYDGKQITRYAIYGAPGYLSYVAEKNRKIRVLFNSAGLDPNFCSDPDFLTFK